MPTALLFNKCLTGGTLSTLHGMQHTTVVLAAQMHIQACNATDCQWKASWNARVKQEEGYYGQPIKRRRQLFKQQEAHTCSIIKEHSGRSSTRQLGAHYQAMHSLTAAIHLPPTEPTKSTMHAQSSNTSSSCKPHRHKSCSPQPSLLLHPHCAPAGAAAGAL